MLFELLLLSTASLVGTPSRRSVITSSAAALTFTPNIVLSAEPEPAKLCDEQCMQERVQRKQELLKQQGRRGKADAKVLYGAAYQAGVRETKEGGDQSPGQGTGLFGFLTPSDVGGVNLKTPDGGK
jgi:hypothetical protein